MPYDPYANAFPAPDLRLELIDLEAGGGLPASAWARSGDRSPALRWGELPPGTESLVVTAFDPDAPIPGGFWHWLVKDLPPTADGLAEAAGHDDSTLPPGAIHLANSMGSERYWGVNPPPGTGLHRLFVCATALDVPTLELPPRASAALLHVMAIPHTLGRGIAIGVSRAPEAR